MESSVEKLEGLAHKLTVEITAETIDQAVAQQLKKLRPRIRIDGFRPGKTPPHIIKQRYGASTRQEILSKEIEAAYRKFVQENEYSPIAQPEINVINGFNDGEPLKFEAIFEIAPEIEVKGLEELTITLPETEITDKDINEMLETLRHQQATFSQLDRAAEENDRVTVDFVGTLEGEAFEGGNGEDVSIIIGDGQMLPDFEDGLKGIKAGEEKTFDVQFPENYHSDNLAGKTAKFTVTVKKVEQVNLPELNEDFITHFGIKTGSIEEFKESVRDNMARELENANRRIRREYLFNAILEKNSDQIIPNISLHQEMNRMAEEMQLNEKIPDEEQRHRLIHQIFEAPAKRRVQLGFLLGKLFEEKQIQLDKEMVNERLDSIASTYEDPIEIKKWYQNNQQAKTSLESAVLEEQLINQLYEAATVNKETKTFQELMTLNNQIRN